MRAKGFLMYFFCHTLLLWHFLLPNKKKLCDIVSCFISFGMPVAATVVDWKSLFACFLKKVIPLASAPLHFSFFCITFVRSCLNLCPWNFYRSFFECFFFFQRRIAGYVTAKKGKTDKKEHKKASTNRGQCNHFFERNLNSF